MNFLCNMNQSFAKAWVTLYNLLHTYSTFYVLGQSHKKWKDSPQTWGVLIEISKLCWSLPRVPKQQGLFQKNMPFAEGISCLQVIFVLIWLKKTLIWFKLQRDETGNGLSNIRDTFAECLQLQMSVLHQSICIFRLVSQWVIWLLSNI